jgi:nitric oxide reductase activation protein
VGEKLAKRPEKIRLLFVISDGFPNATRYNGKKAEEDMLRIKESLERKRITVLTAAIGSDKEQIQRIYKEGFLDISDIGQLPYVLPKQILMRIRR